MCCFLLSWKTVSNQGLSAIGTAGSVITMNPEVGLARDSSKASIKKTLMN